MATKRNIKTPDNLSTVSKVSLLFTRALTQTELTTLACFLSNYFIVPKARVVVGNGVMCPEDEPTSRLLADTTTTTPTTTPTTTATSTATTTTVKVTTNQVQSGLTVLVYFLRDYSIRNDDLPLQLSSEVISNEFKKQMVEAGLPLDRSNPSQTVQTSKFFP